MATLSVGQRVTRHNVIRGSKVWARKVDGGEWFPAVVARAANVNCRVEFETGNSTTRSFAELALRNERRNGDDKPER